MTLLPMSKACLGLSITHDSLCLVEMTRRWRSITCRKITERQLPPDLVRLSPARPNIVNVKEFSQCLNDLVKGISRPQAIALSLPDLCGRTTVFTFSSFPTKTIERESIVSWRFQQDMNISTAKTRLAYRIYEPRKTKRSSHAGSSQDTHVLATAVQHDIIEQYEQVCLEAGLLPTSVGLAGLDIFDLYSSYMPGTGRPPTFASHALDNEFLSLYLANWGFSFVAFRNGSPSFIRVKALPMPRAEQENSADAHATSSPLSSLADTHENETPVVKSPEKYTSLATSTVTNELVATLQYYFETLPFPRDEATSISLYFAEGLPDGASLLPSTQVVGDMLNASLLRSPQITITNYSDKIPYKKVSKLIPNTPAGISGLPAIACVVAT